MSPEERKLLSDLFDRMRNVAGQPRDRDAENFIADSVKAQPYAPYLLAQSVIVQDQALRAATDRIQHLEAELRDLQQRAQQAQPQQQSSGGFLGGLGSLFGGQQPAQPAPRPAGPWGGAPQAAPQPQGGPWGGAPQQGFQPQAAPQQGPWGGAAQQQPAAGGGFLKGALGAAAGVAGGMLLADSVRSMFGGSHGHGAGLGSGGAQNAGLGGGDTVINNYYGDGQSGGGDYVSDADFGGAPSRGDSYVSDADFQDDGFGGGDDDFDA